VERWARVVDGPHAPPEVQWSYDEFRWLHAMMRPLLAVDDLGRIVVGRTLASDRCAVDRTLFGDFDDILCVLLISGGHAHKYQPFAFTRFGADGLREATQAYPPAPSFVPGVGIGPYRFHQFVVFDLAVRGERVAIAGSAALLGDGGTVAFYAAEVGGSEIMVPYDGYLAVLNAGTGALELEHFVGGDRGDLLAGVRWTDEGLLAAGASGWDRWNGGMSISRGSSPLLALAATDGSGALLTRVAPLGEAGRHFHLHSVDATASGAVHAAGLASAPMTHSGDNGRTADMTFGGLRVHGP
jgi:hypothetical protein